MLLRVIINYNYNKDENKALKLSKINSSIIDSKEIPIEKALSLIKHKFYPLINNKLPNKL
jgi:hypothetical protein